MTHSRPSIVILGKIPPPYNGPSIATSIILGSTLREQFELLHVDTRAHDSLRTIGKWSLDKLRRNVGIYWALLRTVRRHRPRLVLVPISQSTTGFLKDSLFILISRLAGSPVLVHLRGSVFREWLRRASPPVRWYANAIVRRSAGAIVLGEKLRSIFEGLLPGSRIFVVPNGSNYAFPPRAPRGPEKRLLYVANLKASKGIEHLTQAVAELRRRGVGGFHVDVVGEWVELETRDRCLELVRAQSLPMTFHGPKYDAEKLAYFSRADLFVFVPRDPEGHPWVVVEAIAAGLPVVATDQGAITESVFDGENGFIVASDPRAIAGAIERVLGDPALLDRMGQASRRRYSEHFTEERMVERLGNVFRTVIRN